MRPGSAPAAPFTVPPPRSLKHDAMEDDEKEEEEEEEDDEDERRCRDRHDQSHREA